MPINKAKAIRLAKVCLWAYDFDETQEDELLEFKGELPLRDTQIMDGQSTPTSFAGIVEYGNVIIVAFQGTITEFGRDGVFRMDSLIDWIQNFRIQQLTASATGLPGLVHEGFFSQLDLIYDKVTAALPRGGGKPIVVTGHSQGGAIATLATKKLVSDGFKVADTYTFAAPRAGDAVFARSVKTPFHRIEFGHDIVPHVPPMLTQSGFFGSGLATLRKFFDLPDVLDALADLTQRLKTNSYQGVGRLTYRSDAGNLLREMTAADERKLFNTRRRQLVRAGKSLVGHHGLSHYISMFR